MILTVREVAGGHTETWCAVRSDKAVTLSEERIAHLDGLVRQARTAAAVFTQLTQEEVDRIVKPMVLAGADARRAEGHTRLRRSSLTISSRGIPIFIVFALRCLGGKEVTIELRLETDELNFLANVLMNPAARKPHSPLGHCLLEMVLARDLRFDSDELERLADLLVAAERSMKDEVQRETNPVRRFELKCRLELLGRTLEKIDEACMMI
jgi:hypothetical protein